MPVKKPTNADPRFWKANAPKGIVIDPKIEPVPRCTRCTQRCGRAIDDSIELLRGVFAGIDPVASVQDVADRVVAACAGTGHDDDTCLPVVHVGRFHPGAPHLRSHRGGWTGSGA